MTDYGAQWQALLRPVFGKRRDGIPHLAAAAGVFPLQGAPAGKTARKRPSTRPRSKPGYVGHLRVDDDLGRDAFDALDELGKDGAGRLYEYESLRKLESVKRKAVALAASRRGDRPDDLTVINQAIKAVLLDAADAVTPLADNRSAKALEFVRRGKPMAAAARELDEPDRTGAALRKYVRERIRVLLGDYLEQLEQRTGQ